jgi:putative transposase
MVEQIHLSERRACRLVGLSRDSYRNPPVMDAQTAALSGAIVVIAHIRRRFGYRRIHDMLRQEFPDVNHKRVYRLYNAAKLAIRKRSCSTRRRSSRAIPRRSERTTARSSPVGHLSVGRKPMGFATC